jgi:hypothetical protein
VRCIWPITCAPVERADRPVFPIPTFPHSFKEALVSTLIAIPLSLLSAFFWLAKFTFFGGWLLARWVAYLTWPLWATIVGLGALVGLM